MFSALFGYWVGGGFVWGGVGRAVMQFMHFLAIFAMLAILATSVTPWYPLQGVRVGML